MALKDKPVSGVPRLPNIEEFRLKNILNTIEDGQNTKAQIVDSILKISQNYSNDQTAQIEQLYQVEQNEVLKRLDSISNTYSIVHNNIDKTYKEISNMSSDLNNNNSRGGLHGIPLLGSYASGAKNQNHGHIHNHNHHHGHKRSKSSGTLASPPTHVNDESYLSKLNRMRSKGIGNGNGNGGASAISSNRSVGDDDYDITGISYDLEDITDMMLESKERINNIVNKLKKIEKNIPVKDKLFSFSSPHKEHYSDLHKFGMRGVKKSTNLSKLKDHILAKSTPLDNKSKEAKKEDSLNVELVENKMKFQSNEEELDPNQDENDVIDNDDDNDDEDVEGNVKESRHNEIEDDIDMEAPKDKEETAETLRETFKNLMTNSNRKSVIINPTMSLFSPIVSSFDPVTSVTSISNNSTKDSLESTESNKPIQEISKVK
ncbi:unnamed protein product [[Candida] boidinii]|uniref:Unnamed protein product n=1 Tax=Candida boidinii TaxID=5477 RepID=A0ACB5TGM6_CANBO|nr:unnamed protein product [[Candida] boidinii]